MTIVVDVLIWLHVLAFALGMAGGVGMSQVGPRLASAASDQRATWAPLVKAFTGMSSAAMGLLLITGPLVVWLKYGGGEGLGLAFMIKMILVLLMIAVFGVGKIGQARLKKGDLSGGKLMAIAGPLTGIMAIAIALAAVVAFH